MRPACEKCFTTVAVHSSCVTNHTQRKNNEHRCNGKRERIDSAAFLEGLIQQICQEQGKCARNGCPTGWPIHGDPLRVPAPFSRLARPSESRLPTPLTPRSVAGFAWPDSPGNQHYPLRSLPRQVSRESLVQRMARAALANHSDYPGNQTFSNLFFSSFFLVFFSLPRTGQSRIPNHP